MGWLEYREWTRSDAHLWNMNLLLRRRKVSHSGIYTGEGTKAASSASSASDTFLSPLDMASKDTQKTRYPAFHYPWLDSCVAWAKYSTSLDLHFCIRKMNMIMERRMSLVNQKDYTCSPSLSEEARQTPLPDRLPFLGISRQDLRGPV